MKGAAAKARGALAHASDEGGRDGEGPFGRGERMAEGMTLGSDVTVKYVLRSAKMALNDSDLSVDSPYNTYTHKGLPLGPICNPSPAAVTAALYPDAEYLALKYRYFCSKDPESGELAFAKSLEEHEANVALYRPLWQAYDQSRGIQ
jgi:UPF0755 protein